jgi:hypothetical protein
LPPETQGRLSAAAPAGLQHPVPHHHTLQLAPSSLSTFFRAGGRLCNPRHTPLSSRGIRV